jgi:hypothetical protein
MLFGLPTAPRACVRGLRHARGALDNPQPAGIAPKKPLRTVLTSGATSEITLIGLSRFVGPLLL